MGKNSITKKFSKNYEVLFWKWNFILNHCPSHCERLNDYFFFGSKFFLFVVLLALKSINNNQIVNSSSHQDRHHVYTE